MYDINAQFCFSYYKMAAPFQKIVSYRKYELQFRYYIDRYYSIHFYRYVLSSYPQLHAFRSKFTIFYDGLSVILFIIQTGASKIFIISNGISVLENLTKKNQPIKQWNTGLDIEFRLAKYYSHKTNQQTDINLSLSIMSEHSISHLCLVYFPFYHWKWKTIRNQNVSPQHFFFFSRPHIKQLSPILHFQVSDLGFFNFLAI